MTKKHRVVLAGSFAALLVLPALGLQTYAQEIESGYKIAVDKEGSIRVPDVDYLAKWQFLGTWSSLAEDGKGAADLHNVYAQPGVIEAYRATGEFPDGAVLIKDILLTKTQDMTTGTISHATKREGWFVMIKDTKGRFKGNPLWGDGWGWAWFDADAPTKTTTTDYKENCIQCHLPVKETDWIHTFAYPSLK